MILLQAPAGYGLGRLQWNQSSCQSPGFACLQKQSCVLPSELCQNTMCVLQISEAAWLPLCLAPPPGTAHQVRAGLPLALGLLWLLGVVVCSVGAVTVIGSGLCSNFASCVHLCSMG